MEGLFIQVGYRIFIRFNFLFLKFLMIKMSPKIIDFSKIQEPK